MFHIRRRDIAVMMLIGVLIALDQSAYVVAIAYTGAAVATLIAICMAPVLVTLASVTLARERLSRRGILALVSALTGTALLIGFRPGTSVPHGTLTGVLFALLSAGGYAGVILCGRFIAGRYHPLQTTTIGFGTGTLVLLGIALATGFVAAYPPQGWLLLAYLGAVPTALAYGLFLHGMRSTPASVASIVVLLEPLTATLLAWALFGERLGPFGLLGACLLLGALVVLSRSERSKN
jgi:DME family drug/metabolite transporter